MTNILIIVLVVLTIAVLCFAAVTLVILAGLLKLRLVSYAIGRKASRKVSAFLLKVSRKILPHRFVTNIATADFLN